ncbi:MAG: thioredoxin domain-containing protein [Parachlamydiales bacterium]
MNTLQQSLSEDSLIFRIKQPPSLFWLNIVFLLAPIILTYIASLHICSEACTAGQNYRLFGLAFEIWGFILCPFFLLLHITSRRIPAFIWLTTIAVAGALGAEAWFIYVQKYYIGHWCPVCLAIAACLIIAFVIQVITIAIGHDKLSKIEKEGVKMKYYLGSLTTFTVAVLGFFIAFVGLSKVDKLEAAQDELKEKITFGNTKSPIEVYLFTDWQCPSCRKIEPVIEKATTSINKKARLVFVDFPIHPETMNFTPYNLAFMVNNKDKYLKLRHILTTLSEQTGAPTEEQVAKAIQPLGVKYQQLNYADVAVAFKYYKDLAKQFNINSTPTVVLINLDTKKGKKLKGGVEITEANILNAIDALK